MSLMNASQRLKTLKQREPMLTREQFESFCGSEGSSRYDVTTPYQYGDCTVATDTKMAVIIPRNAEWEGKEVGRRADFSLLGIDGEFDKGEWHKWSEIVEPIPLSKTEECEECGGAGALEHQCDCGHCHDCECGACDGKGEITETVRHRILDSDFGNLLLLKFAVINPIDCRIHLLNKVGTQSKSLPFGLLIRGEGWNGILMSMSKE